MKSMTYFTAPSGLAFAFLFAGIVIAAVSVAATALTATVQEGSPPVLNGGIMHRTGALTGAALAAIGAIPLLWAPATGIIMSALSR